MSDNETRPELDDGAIGAERRRGPHDHRDRPGLVRRADRRLASPARRRRVGARSRFGERVAHGMLVLSYAVGLVPFDPERVVALRGLDSVTFKRPVLIGDTIRVRSRVEACAAARRRARAGRLRLAGRQPGRAAGRPGAGRGAVAPRPGGRRRSPRRRARERRSLRRAGAAVILEGKRDRRHRGRQPALDRLRDRRAGASEQGAEVVLTSFGRMRRMTERAAKRLPEPSPTCSSSTSTATRTWRRSSTELGRPLGPGRRRRPRDRPRAARRARRQLPRRAARERRHGVRDQRLLAEGARRRSRAADGYPNGSGPAGGSIVGLDFDASVAWPAYDWMGVAKAALESVSRYLARDLGPRGIRVNLISAGPISTPAASGIPGFEDLRRRLVRRGAAGLGSLRRRRRSPTRRCSCSPTSRGRSAARSSTPTVAFTRSAPLRPRHRSRRASQDPVRPATTESPARRDGRSALACAVPTSR